MNLHNINVIARYEVKLLRRSWLFKIFAVLALLGITLTMLFNWTSTINSWMGIWSKVAVSSMMPFACTYFYNIAQSVIVIFLAGNFLKRDKKMDTAEVIYVRPMSNADYIIGKTWGIMRVFLSLNIIMLLITAFLNLAINRSPFSIFPYVFYFLTISLPSLLFVLGLSFTAMCVLKNQAVTFIVMLGAIGVAFFYLDNTLFGVFDFFGVNIPAIFSDVTGHADIRLFLLQRFIYLLLGIGLLSFTISLVKRLPHRPWKIIIVNTIGSFFIVAGLCAGLLYVLHYRHISELRNEYITTYNEYAQQGKAQITSHDITFEQQGQHFSGQSTLKIENNQQTKLEQILLYLNPALMVTSVETNGTSLQYQRKTQVIAIDRSLDPGEEITLTLKYNGGIEENICYTDILAEDYFNTKIKDDYHRLGKRYAWLEDKFTLLTPECLWYPVSIPPVNPQAPYDISKNFTQYTLTVLNPGEKTVLSQGIGTPSDNKIVFTNPTTLTGISLTIADYEKKSIEVDSIKYEIYYFKGHDFFSEQFSELKDTLPGRIRETKEDIERGRGRNYPFSKFAFAETPVQFATYIRNWKGYTEYLQPEIVLIPERGATLKFDIKSEKDNMRRWGRRGEDKMEEIDIQLEVLSNFVYSVLQSETIRDGRDWNSTTVNPTYLFPMFFGYVNFINSPEYPVIDVAFNTMQNTSTPMRSWWGGIINDSQKANLYLESHSLKEALADTTLKPIVFYELLKLKSNALKNYILSHTTKEIFDTFLKDYFASNQFTEISFEEFCEAFTEETGIDLSGFIHDWYTQNQTPTILISSVDANQVLIDELTLYQVKFKVYNQSATQAIITAETRQGGGRGRRGGGGGASTNEALNYIIPAGEAREIKIIIEDRPSSLSVNTNISHNLPTLRTFNFSKVDNTTSDTTQGIFVTDAASFNSGGNEIIIDNESSGFQTIESNNRNKLKDLFKKEDSEKYKNFTPWWSPSKWTLVAGDFCYGESVSSAVYKKKGSGANSVVWSAEIPRDGYYEVSIWNPKMESHGGWDEKHTQTYTIYYGSDKEDVDLDIKKEDLGWVSVGNFYLPKGTVKIVLTDKVSDGYYVIADAVKFTATE